MLNVSKCRPGLKTIHSPSRKTVLKSWKIMRLLIFMLTCMVTCIRTTDFDQDPDRDLGFAENIHVDVKFQCPSFEKRLYSVGSEIQCHHRCLRSSKCALLNFRGQGSVGGNKDNCEVFGVSGEDNSCQSIEGMTGWKAVVFQRVNITKPPSPIEPMYEDCKKAFVENSVSGVYKLSSGYHYCVMENLPGCGEGGWTLALKVNGSKDTFTFSSLFWTNNHTFGVEDGLKSFDSAEAKFPAFNSLSFKTMCIGMQVQGTTKWTSLHLNSTSLPSNSTLMDIFKNNGYVSTALGRNTWKSLVANASLQPYCNREGFNVIGDGNELKLRIGMVSNQEENCLTPESFIGIGSTMVSLCNPAILPISSGNFAACFADNGEKSLASMGFLLIQ